jgi:hypothetical protein
MEVHCSLLGTNSCHKCALIVVFRRLNEMYLLGMAYVLSLSIWLHSFLSVVIILCCCLSNPDSSPPPPLWRCDPSRVMAFSFLMFLDNTQRRTTVGRIPLDKWSARRRDNTPDNTPTHQQPDNTQHSQQTNIYASDGIQTHDLSRRAAVDLHLRPGGHWDRQSWFIPDSN